MKLAHGTTIRSAPMRLRRLLAASLLLLTAGFTRPAGAYSLLTHEQLIDLTWQSSIVPLLRSRYPSITPAQLEEARAYAYGGSVIQDIGYYPLGDEFFSNLTHYVRSGDFVVNLFRDAQSADELAFATGALSHYVGDSLGHSEATNLSVPVEFPSLRRRFGSSVSYAEGEHQHVETEFAFDINEIAHHRLAPLRYLRHVGFAVPLDLVSRAFYETYGLRVDFSGRRAARVNVRAFRFSARSFIPRVAYAETILHRRHEPAEQPGPELQQLQALVAEVETDSDWAVYRRHAGLGTYTLAGLIFIIPKFGALKLAAIKGPTTATEAEYIHSVLASAGSLDATLRNFTPIASRGVSLFSAPQTLTRPTVTSPDPLHPLINRDLDTGRPVRPAGYRLTDDTYALLLARLTATPAQPIPPGIRRDIQRYYADLSLPFATKAKPAAWAAVQKNLATLATMPVSAEPAVFPTYDTTDTAPTQKENTASPPQGLSSISSEDSSPWHTATR